MANKAKTTEQFKKEIYDRVQDEYTVLGEYKTNKTKIKMRHNLCNYEWDVEPSSFLKGTRCPNCSHAKQRKTQEQFEKEIYDLVGDEYTLITEYKNCYEKVLFKHNVCGNEFMMKPNGFLSGNRCPKCGIKSRTLLKTKTHNDFLSQVFDKYEEEYSVIDEYVNSRKSLKFRHNICGCEFNMIPNNFLKSSLPCPNCDNRVEITTDVFKQEVYDLVGDEYSVLGEYHNAHAKIQLKHNKCGYIYDGCRNMFLKGHRCPQCYSSKGEEKISRFFQKKNIGYKSQKTFKDLVGLGGGYLKYDFFIPDYKLLIEYNGEQHYKPVEAFGGEKQLEIQQEHDRRKRKYAENNGFQFIEIGYWDFNNIDEILNRFIKEAA